MKILWKNENLLHAMKKRPSLMYLKLNYFFILVGVKELCGLECVWVLEFKVVEPLPWCKSQVTWLQ